MKLFDIATDIYEELSNPDDISVSSIQYFLAANVGKINNLLNKSYSLDSSSAELTEDLGIKEAVILKKLYLIHNLDLQIKANLGAAGVNSVLEISSDGANFRTVNKNEIAKTYIQLRKEERAELEILINSYNISESQLFGLSSFDNTLDIPRPRLFRIRTNDL